MKKKIANIEKEHIDRITHKIHMIQARYGFAGHDTTFEGIIRSEQSWAIRRFLTDIQELVFMVMRDHQCKYCRKE